MQASIVRTVAARVAALWRRLAAAAVLESWQSVSSDVQRAVVAGQLAAAQASVGYVDEALAEHGSTAAAAGTLVAAAFAGTAADGRDLGTLLDWPVTGRGGVLDRIGQGLTPAQALYGGGRRLQLLAVTTVQDAGRAAVGVDIAQHERIGYVRTINPPSCARCVILAGRWYRWDAGFQRHPACDCRAVAAAEADSEDLITDPIAYVRSLPADEQDAILTRASGRAFRDGADLNQLVNARRGLSQGGLTTEGTTKRGLAGNRLGGRKRMTPELIYKLASDRAEAISLLRSNGYIL